MKWSNRPNGISVLVACQNEEAIVHLCIKSFLDFGDELIVVDNGSHDRTKEIVRDLEVKHPQKIKFFDVPELPDLYHNRQYAFEKSKYRWVVRLDSDYVAYTEGEESIYRLRKHLLNLRSGFIPHCIGVPQTNVTGDFAHTGKERTAVLTPLDPGYYVPPPVSKPMMRIYEVFSGFRFKRLGRWEGIRYQNILRRFQVNWPYPVWMHCNLKSNINYLYRSERTNWRELGDYERFPTLRDYLVNVVPDKYKTGDLDQAAQIYLRNNLYPCLQPYDTRRYYAYPSFVQEQMAKFWPYEIMEDELTCEKTRIYHGPIIE